MNDFTAALWYVSSNIFQDYSCTASFSAKYLYACGDQDQMLPALWFRVSSSMYSIHRDKDGPLMIITCVRKWTLDHWIVLQYKMKYLCLLLFCFSCNFRRVQSNRSAPKRSFIFQATNCKAINVFLHLQIFVICLFYFFLCKLGPQHLLW